jgi:hypothetical protein
MNPAIATMVISKFLLPMFEEDNRHIIAKGRAKSYGLAKDETSEETKYKLSDKLAKDLTKTHSDLESLNT